MKKFWISVILLLSVATLCLAADKIETPANCKQCGMNRTTFSHSRMVVTYADGSSTGTCSLNCVVSYTKKAKGMRITAYQVADYNSKKLTDAKKATWVFGGKKEGVMTQVPNWAFAKKKNAEAFIVENGGKLATFDEALKAAEEENKEPKGHEGHTH